MFYSQFILAKKGPLGTIWIAAHLERKLRKNQVADTDIGVSVDSILCPDVPIALRLSSHLLLGVVRIYSRKVNYLFDDCSDTLLKVKQAFRSTAVDLPPEQAKAPYHSITLPETFDLDDFELPDNEIFQGNDRHVSTREQITLQDTMDGATFTTSQFGPDERFGDGDASQIGLDLEEDLFLEKEDAAGTSGVVKDTAVDQSSAKETTSFKDEHDERDSDLPLNSSSNYFNIQAPSTPGLMDEPNLASVEEALVSDDHMDDDHDIPELAAKQVPGTESSQVEPSSVRSNELSSNGNLHQLDEPENKHVSSNISVLPNEVVEAIPPGNTHSFDSNEHIETTAVDSLENNLEYTPLQNKETMAVGSQFSKRDDEHDFADLNMCGYTIPAEVHDRDICVDASKADLNGPHLPDSGIPSENKNILTLQEASISEEIETVMVNNGFQCQISDQPCLNLENSEAIKNNGMEESSVFSTPMLKPCNSHGHSIHGVEEVPDVSTLPAENYGCSLGLTSKQDATNVSEISTVVHGTDSMTSIRKADHITCEGSDFITSDRALDNQISSEGYDVITSNRPLENDCLGQACSETENNSKVSDFSAPEKLLSVPNLPTGQLDNIHAEFTPGVKIVARDGDCTEAVAGDGDASFEEFLSGKKRTYTESTLTNQSLNSAASSNADQSKQSVKLVPEDDDLLSSILGGRSTTFKMKPTPPVSDSLRAKRQRTSTRSSAQKRKVLMDDSMVLHGDMIREQLTNTEDIRRVRKKAPCTRLEVWVLQKQFLGDEIFSEPLLTGLLPEFRCLHSQQLDLSGIVIVQDDRSKGSNETGTSSRLHGERIENESFMPSAAGDKENQEHADSLEKTPSMYESGFVADALQKELETFDNEIAKQMSNQDVPGKKADMENDDQVAVEGNQPVVSIAEQTSSVSLVPEVTCNLNNLTDTTEVDTPYVNETTDVVASGDIDASCRSIEFTREDISTKEEECRLGGENQVEDVFVDGKSVDGSLLEKREGIVSADTIAVMEDVRGTCSSPIQDIAVTDSVELETRDSPKLDTVFEERHLDECRPENEKEFIVSNAEHDDSYPKSTNFLEEDVNIEHSHIVETDLNSEDIRMSGNDDQQFLEADSTLVTDPMSVPSGFAVEIDLNSQDIKMSGKDDQQRLETDHTLVTDPMAVPSGSTNPADLPDFGMEVMEHDTDFLNVDDDDVAEDYEDDAPNPEEKRMLDNSGWSSRTRAVANYLKVLFEKENHHTKMVIPLESLLVGKTRKEASRMFFETLVLKTKDYIDTKQEAAFSDIKIKPTAKIMKSQF